jgi:hypothetical protein
VINIIALTKMKYESDIIYTNILTFIFEIAKYVE